MTYSTVIGIDPSLTGCGIARRAVRPSAVNPPLLTTIGSAAPTEPGYVPKWNRLDLHAAEIAWHVQPNSLVLLEGPAYMKNTASTHMLAGFWWTLLGRVTFQAADIVVVAPSALKQFATGRGNASKEDVMLAVVRRWPGFEIKGNDQADAVTLLQMGRALTGDPEIEVPAQHRKALSKLDLSGTRLAGRAVTA